MSALETRSDFNDTKGNIMKTQVVKNTFKNWYSISSLGNSYYTKEALEDKENHPMQEKSPEQMSKFELMQYEVKQNKEEINQTKNRLEMLEHQIFEITDRIDSFKNDTDKIIEGIARRIQEAEQRYEENKSPNGSKAF